MEFRSGNLGQARSVGAVSVLVTVSRRASAYQQPKGRQPSS